ncbi:MAG: diguanylate cyclase [Methylocystaceae bacterium]|nr:diguanylate cyclase [Methylocystaceae bacterium]
MNSVFLLIGFVLICLAFCAGWLLARRKYDKLPFTEDRELIEFIIDSVDRLPDGVARFNKDEKLVYCNATYRALNTVIEDLCIPGTSFEELARGKVMRDWQGDKDGLTQEEYIAKRVATFRSGKLEWEEEYDDGSWVLARDHPTDDGGRVCLRLDITERKKAEECIRHMANHDRLTGLPSLRLAEESLLSTLKLADRHKWKFAVFFIDLDGFKSINDQFGHQCGDHVLKQVADRLSHCLRQSDLVARIGGDEFLVIQNEVHKQEDCTDVAEKIIAELSRPFDTLNDVATIGVSIGIAIYPDDGKTPAELIKAADQVMYEVKFGGKNNYRFAVP